MCIHKKRSNNKYKYACTQFVFKDEIIVTKIKCSAYCACKKISIAICEQNL